MVEKHGSEGVIVFPPDFNDAATCSNLPDTAEALVGPEARKTHKIKSLVPNTCRMVHLRDNDDDFIYDISPERHWIGCYEIELLSGR